MSMQKNESAVWSFLDGLLDSAQSEQYRQWLEEDAAFMELHKECIQIHNSLSSIPLASPGPAFTQNLINQIAETAVPVMEVDTLKNMQRMAQMILIGGILLLIVTLILSLAVGTGSGVGKIGSYITSVPQVGLNLWGFATITICLFLFGEQWLERRFSSS